MAFQPAFSSPVSAEHARLARKRLGHFSLLSRRQCSVRAQPPVSRRARVRMIGPFLPDFSNSKIMQSEIVRKEIGSLERDYAELSRLAPRYDTFDREGKLIYVDSALDIVDRFSIFLARLRLSEDFAAKLFITQYEVRLEQFGLTIDSLIKNTNYSLKMMKDEAQGS